MTLRNRSNNSENSASSGSFAVGRGGGALTSPYMDTLSPSVPAWQEVQATTFPHTAWKGPWWGLSGLAVGSSCRGLASLGAGSAAQRPPYPGPCQEER